MIEVARGCVEFTECDGLGHMGAPHYVRKASEGLDILAVHLGRPDRNSADPPPHVLDLHIRFHRELRASSPYSVWAGLLGHSRDRLRVYEELRDAAAGSVAATFVSEIPLGDAASGRSSVSAANGTPSKALRTELPQHGTPRGLDLDAELASPTLVESRKLGLFTTYRGLVGPQACDHHGRMHLHEYLARISNPTPTPLVHSAAAAAVDRWTPLAQVETRIVFHRPLSVGDVAEIHCGLRALGSRSFRFVHWMFEARSGLIAASADVIAIPFDLAARRAVGIDAALRELLSPYLIPELSI